MEAPKLKCNRCSLVAQQVMDLMLSLLWLWSLLWCEFDAWPGKFYTLWVQPPKNSNNREILAIPPYDPNLLLRIINFFFLFYFSLFSKLFVMNTCYFSKMRGKPKFYKGDQTLPWGTVGPAGPWQRAEAGTGQSLEGRAWGVPTHGELIGHLAPGNPFVPIVPVASVRSGASCGAYKRPWYGLSSSMSN